jgi:predicted DNA-binding transcriptional regulator YafY
MSYRTDLTERLIEIPFLLAHRSHSRQELARIYQVDVKTISKDIAALSRNLPIELKRKGREVYYGFPNDYKFIIPSFSPQELGVLLLAQESIAGIGITVKGSIYAKYTDTLLEKIRHALPVFVTERMNALSSVYGSASIPAKDFAKHTETIDRLAHCAVHNKKIEIRYHGLNSNEEKTRILEPYAVYFDPDGATLKLVAFDPKYQKPRVFSIDHIRNIKELEEKFTRPKDFELKEFLNENCFNGIHGESITVRLKATGITARIFSERKYHPSQKIVERKQRRGNSPETITVEMRVANGCGLVRFILSHSPNIEIISPEELRQEVRKVLLNSLKKF